MLHYITWKVLETNKKKIIKNDFFGVEAVYLWEKTSWDFLLYPHFDQNHSTYFYYAFDNFEQKDFFTLSMKLPWVWAKTAYLISMQNQENLKNAIENYDLKFFQNIPWIWTKTARRIIVELKSSIESKDLSKLDIDEKLYNDIIKTLKPYWFDTEKVKVLLSECDIKLEKSKINEIIKWLLDNYN